VLDIGRIVTASLSAASVTLETRMSKRSSRGRPAGFFCLERNVEKYTIAEIGNGWLIEFNGGGHVYKAYSGTLAEALADIKLQSEAWRGAEAVEAIPGWK
jgi:hypothetical protein